MDFTTDGELDKQQLNTTFENTIKFDLEQSSAFNIPQVQEGHSSALNENNILAEDVQIEETDDDDNIILDATSATVEGQTTAHYIEDMIKNNKIKITKLAQGLPVGGEIEQLDDGTLFSAFRNRTPVNSK